jgi:hypothetical protein
VSKPADSDARPRPTAQGLPGQPGAGAAYATEGPQAVAKNVAPVVPPRKGRRELIRPFNGRTLAGWDYTETRQNGEHMWSV